VASWCSDEATRLKSEAPTNVAVVSICTTLYLGTTSRHGGDQLEQEETARPSYKVAVEGPGLNVNKEVAEDTTRQIIDILLGGTSTAPASVSRLVVGATGGSQTGPTPSLREYMDAAGAGRNPEKIVAIGRYLTSELGHQGFTRADVKAQFKNAGEATPGNYSRDFTWAVSNGWIAPDASGAYYVTKKGENAMDRQFPTEVRRATKQARKARKRTRRAAESDND
jgi:hypothetical protein